MPEAESSVVIVNSVLNFLNLALAAWILRQQQSQAGEVKRTSTRTRKCSKRVTKVEGETSQQLGRIVELLTLAFPPPSKAKAAGNPRRSPVKPEAASKRGRK